MKKLDPKKRLVRRDGKGITVTVLHSGAYFMVYGHRPRFCYAVDAYGIRYPGHISTDDLVYA